MWFKFDSMTALFQSPRAEWYVFYLRIDITIQYSKASFPYQMEKEV